jgi:hypothetical protein
MAVKSEYLGGASDWEDGEVLDAEDLLDTFQASYPKVFEVYTGSDYNSSRTSNAAGDNDADHELTEIPSSELTNKKYVELTMVGAIASSGWTTGTGTVRTKAQVKDLAGSYADIEDYTVRSQMTVSGGTGFSRTDTGTYIMLIPITTDMKTHGARIKCFSRSSTSTTTSNHSASYTNKTTIVKLL